MHTDIAEGVSARLINEECTRAFAIATRFEPHAHTHVSAKSMQWIGINIRNNAMINEPVRRLKLQDIVEGLARLHLIGGHVSYGKWQQKHHSTGYTRSNEIS